MASFLSLNQCYLQCQVRKKDDVTWKKKDDVSFKYTSTQKVQTRTDIR